MNETTARFLIPSEVVAREIPEGLMLVNVQTGAAFKLNQVGAAVWRRLDGSSDLATIVADLDRQYQVGTKKLLEDVDALLEDLRKEGLVRPVPTPPT